MSPLIATEKKHQDKIIAELEAEAIDFFVRFMSMLGLSRSVGEIYGLLYISQEPLNMDDIVQRLGLSSGSASQGLKSLRSLKAVQVTYQMGERKDYYVAEYEFRKIIGSFFKEEIVPQLEVAGAKVGKMQETADSIQDEEVQSFYSNRLSRLKRFHKAAKTLLPALAKIM